MYSRRVVRPLFAGLALSSLVAGCAATGMAWSPSPLASALFRPVAVQVVEPSGSELVLGLPKGALTSEAVLLGGGAEELCFDVKMRTWQGGVRRWNATLAVDGKELDEREVELSACTAGSLEPDEPARPTLSCLAVDTVVSSLATDDLEAVKVRGSRLCLQHHGSLAASSKEVRLELAQGAASFSFRWELTRSAPRAAAPSDPGKADAPLAAFAPAR